MLYNIKILRWFNFFTDFKLYASIAIIYFAQVTGSFALGMSIFAITMISSAFLEIPTGVFSDRIGRRKTLIYGAAAAVMCTTFYAIGFSYWILVIGALFEGFSRSFYSGNNDALLHETLRSEGREHEYGEYLGKVSSMFQFALATSAVLGGLLATWSIPLIMWLSVIPQIICLVLAFKIREPKVHSNRSGNIYEHLKEAYKNFLDSRKLRLLSVSSILGYSFGEASYDFRAAFYATVWPLWAIGLIRMFSNILAGLSFHFSGRVIQRFSVIKIFIVDNASSRIINIFATLFPSILSPLLMATTSLFYGVTTVGRNSLMQKEFSNEQRATMGSLNSFAGSIVFGIVAIILGFTADIFTPDQALLYFQFIQVINIFIYIRLLKYYPRYS